MGWLWCSEGPALVSLLYMHANREESAEVVLHLISALPVWVWWDRFTQTLLWDFLEGLFSGTSEVSLFKGLHSLWRKVAGSMSSFDFPLFSDTKERVRF